MATLSFLFILFNRLLSLSNFTAVEMNAHINFLPPDIMLVIFGATVKRKVNSISADLQINSGITKSLLSLSHVCKCWREIILNTFCSRHSIFSDNLFENIEPADGSYLKSKAFLASNIMRIRCLYIEINWPNIANNNVLQLLESPLHSNICYSSATSVNVLIRIADDHYDESAANVMDENSTRITQVISKLAPNFQKVSFDYIKKWRSSFDNMCVGIYPMLAEKLCKYKPIKHASISVGKSVCITSLGPKISNLTRVYLFWSEKTDTTLRFIRINARTLQEIRISNIFTDGIDGLFNDNDAPITYTYLTKLWLGSCLNEEQYVPERRPVFRDIVPFPRLQNVKIGIIYPFGDDVIFRGNSSCLKALEIKLDKESLFMLSKSMQLSGNTFQRLKVIKMSTFIDEIEDNQASILQHTQMLMSARQTVEYISIHDYDIAEKFTAQLDPKQLFQNIRAIHLQLYETSLHDIFIFLNVMPKVQIISSGILELSNIEQAVTTPGWLENLHAKYGTLHKNFQYWRLHFDMGVIEDGTIKYISNVDESVDCIVIYSLILAILCPNFRGIWITSTHIAKYIEGIRRKMDEAPFNAYKQCFEKLFGIGSSMR